MSVLLIALGFMLVIALGIGIWYLDRAAERKKELDKESEKTERTRAKADEKIVTHAEEERYRD